MEQNGFPNGFLLRKGSFIGKILANLARIITSHNPSQVGMVFERLINIVASCDKVSQKSLANLARLFYNNFRPSWAEVNEIIIPNLGIFLAATSRQLVGKLEDDRFENASQVGTHFYQCCTNGNEATRLSTCDHDGHKFRGGSPIEIVPMMGTIIVSNFCSS